MSNTYIKIDGYEYDVNWLTRVVITSTLPGNERALAYIDDEPEGDIYGKTFEIVRSLRPEIIEKSDSAKLCESLGEIEPKPSNSPEPFSEEWWEEFRKSYYNSSSTSDRS